MVIQSAAMLSMLPQKPPFVMIDSLIFSDEISSTTSFLITSENVLVSDNEFSEAGLLENIAQTAAAHAAVKSYNNNLKPVQGFIGAIKNFEVFALPICGKEIETQIKVDYEIFDITQISGLVICKGEVLARCEMNIFVQKPE